MPGVTAPAIGRDGTVYVQSFRIESDGNPDSLTAINPDGSIKWQHDFARTMSTTFSSSPPVIAPDGIIWVESLDFHLYAIRPDGGVKCSASFATSLATGPAIAPDGTVYVAAYHGLFAFTPACQLKWQFPFPDAGGLSQIASPAVGADGTVYVPGPGTTRYAANLYAVGPDGTLKWTFAGGDHAYSSPAIASDGTVYFGNDQLYALTPGGVLKWAQPCPGVGSTGSPVVDASGTVYWQLNYAACAVDANGIIKWTRQTGSSYVPASPVVAPDGSLYLGSGGYFEPPILQVISDDRLPVALNYPVNGAIQVPNSAILTWSQMPGAVSYDVYFGNADPPPLVTNVTAPKFSPALAHDTRYYWQVVPPAMSVSRCTRPSGHSRQPSRHPRFRRSSPLQADSM
jgi:outer membrane protein assembly factor BamB